MPCATQNELNGDDAKTLVDNGCILCKRGSEYAKYHGAVGVFLESKILYAQGKASNAGGVATSGLEMSQNSMRLSWTREEVDKELHKIMKVYMKPVYCTVNKKMVSLICIWS